MWVLRALSEDLETAFISEPSVQWGRCPETGQIQYLLCDSPESLTYAFDRIQKLLIEKSMQHDSKMNDEKEQGIENIKVIEEVGCELESAAENIPSIAMSTNEHSIVDTEKHNENIEILNLDMEKSIKMSYRITHRSDRTKESQLPTNESQKTLGSEKTSDCVKILDTLHSRDDVEVSLNARDEIRSPRAIQPDSLPDKTETTKEWVNEEPTVLCKISQSFNSSDGNNWSEQNFGLRRSSRRRLVNKRYKLWMSNSLPAEKPELEEAEGASTDDGKTRKNYEEAMPFKYFCEKCSFKTKRISHLKKHKAIHKKVKTMHSCSQCSFTSMRLGHLRRHEASHSSVLHKCDNCTYSTDDAKLLLRHCKQKHYSCKTSTDSRLLKCIECTYKTQRQHLFDRHKRIHCVHTHQCKQCPYRTWRKEHYTRHVNNVHKNKRPYLCHLCGKAFKRGDSLRHHQTIFHSSDPSSTCSFTCELCGKTFRTQSHLDEHNAVHSNVRSFLCEICGASFKTRSVQRKHVQTIHQNPRSKSCIYCDKKFNTVFALRRHLKVHNCKNEAGESQQKKSQIGSIEVGEPTTSTGLVPISGETKASILSGENKISIINFQPPTVEGDVLHDTVLTAEMIGTLHPSTTVLQSTEVTSALFFLTSAPIIQ